MRLFSLLLILGCGSLAGSESRPAYPLWDGHESVADYAKKVNLLPTKTLDLGSGVKLELVLIPAGKFVMGTPEPAPVDEDGFYKKIVIGQTLVAASGAVLLVMLIVVGIRALRQRRRPQMSLGRLLLVTVAAGGCVLSGLHWRQSVQKLKAARLEYAAAQARFNNAETNERPAHSVTLTQPFYMGKFVVTQEQYQAVLGTNPSRFKGRDNPVEMVLWDDAAAFCKKLAEQTKQSVRLPTEAEWEYACRAGTTSDYYSGDTEADLNRVAWYSANTPTMSTHPVGQKEANAFGLFDMHGNVWQWCEDWHAQDYYGKSEAENPQGPTLRAGDVDFGGGYVLRGGYEVRGGHWNGIPGDCRSAARCWREPGTRDDDIGFRMVVSVPDANAQR